MAKVEGLQRLVSLLRARAAKSLKDDNVSVLVGYTAAYAIYVHENMEMKWRGLPRRSKVGVYWGPHGQAKFLEGPARQFSKVLGEIAAKALSKGKTMAEALLMAGLRLQRESQQVVPVEYGNLRASAFTRLDQG